MKNLKYIFILFLFFLSIDHLFDIKTGWMIPSGRKGTVLWCR